MSFFQYLTNSFSNTILHLTNLKLFLLPKITKSISSIFLTAFITGYALLTFNGVRILKLKFVLFIFFILSKGLNIFYPKFIEKTGLSSPNLITKTIFSISTERMKVTSDLASFSLLSSSKFLSIIIKVL